MSLRSAFQNLPKYLSIDSIESYSRKSGRIDKIKEFFELKPITDNARVSGHLKKKIKGKDKDKHKDITGGLYAPNAPFSFAILKDNRNDYRFAYFIAYSLKSYKEHKELSETAKDTLDKLFTVCPPSSIDICFDTPTKPNFEALGLFGKVTKPYRKYETRYLNEPELCGIDRVIIYDKSLKDELAGTLWRIEFTLPISQALRFYEPPIEEMERVITAVF